MKNGLTFAIALGVALFASGVQAEHLVNGGFETGDFTGWSQYLPSGVSTSVVSSHSSAVQVGIPTLYTPQEGNYMARLSAGDSSYAVRIEQEVALRSGDVLSGMAAFDAGDSQNDGAYVRIFDAVSNSSLATPWMRRVSDVGDFGDGSWEAWSWTAPSDGTYRVGMYQFNAGEAGGASYALFDMAPVPEPMALVRILSLAAMGLVGLVHRRRRNRA